MPNLLSPRSFRTAALLYGVGNSSAPYQWQTAGKNALGFWVKSLATSGDSRGLYLRLYLNGAGGGEAVRAFATAGAASVATGGTMNGIHATASIGATGSSISGAANGGRFTLAADAVSRTLSGTLAAIQLCSDIGANNTLPASHAFIRFTDDGSVRFTNLMEIPNAANGTIFAAHVTQVMSHSIKIRSADGTAYYVMCTNTATNRS